MKKHNASEHLVCFSCRKQFRKPSRWQGVRLELRLYHPHEVKENLIKDYVCPDCKNPMVNMGRFFKPPRQTDKRSWAQLRRFAPHGLWFDIDRLVPDFHCKGQPRPSSAEVERFVTTWVRRPSAGQRLLNKIKQQEAQQGSRK